MKTVAAAMLCLLFAGCTVQRAHPVGVIDVRNESRQSVRVEVDGLANGDQPVEWVPTWIAGWCPMAEIGFSDDGVPTALQQARIVLSGPSLSGPMTFPGTAADILSGGLVLTIDSSGTVHVSHEELPTPSAGCAFYPQDAQPR
jgi:hypothetical protein